MTGPIYESNTLNYQLSHSLTLSNWYEPSVVKPTPTTTSTAKASKSDYVSKFKYYQAGRHGMYHIPLPYDTYGAREIQRLAFKLETTYRYTNSNWYQGSNTWRYSYRRQVLEGDALTFPSLLTPTLPERTPEGALITAALDKAGEAKINMAVALAEMDKTVGMIGRRVKQMARAISAVRKGKFNNAAKILGITTPKGVGRTKHWSNNFLEYQYGWTPLVLDVCDGARFLAEFLRTQPILTTQARVELPYAPVVTSRNYLASSLENGLADSARHWTLLRTTDTTVERHVVTFLWALDGPMMRELNNLGLLDQEVQLWERVPFSFVVDWFANIGSFLNARAARHSLHFIGGSYTRKKGVDREVTVTGYTQPYASGTSGVTKAFSQNTGRYNGFVMRRELYEEIPPPQITLNLPTSRTWNKAIVATALARQRVK